MQQSSKEYERWEGRFGGTDYAFGKEPNYFLASCKPFLPIASTLSSAWLQFPCLLVRAPRLPSRPVAGRSAPQAPPAHGHPPGSYPRWRRLSP